MFSKKESKKNAELEVTSEPATVVEESKPDLILDGRAYSTRVIDGKYEVIEISFDSKTLELGNIKVLHSDGDRGTMIERFKISCVTGGVI
jgi:hypothetical protein